MLARSEVVMGNVPTMYLELSAVCTAKTGAKPKYVVKLKEDKSIESIQWWDRDAENATQKVNDVMRVQIARLVSNIEDLNYTDHGTLYVYVGMCNKIPYS